MSRAGNYFRTGMSIVNTLAGEKPHSSITDWVEVLSSDRYGELSLDGIPELVDSVNLQGPQGTAEAARAIRKKLKYGNVHRQLRALVILRALTENASKGFQLNWADERLMERLKLMATDSLLDPKVKKRLILVFHAWSIQYAEEPRMREVAGLYKQYAGGGARRASVNVGTRESASAAAANKSPQSPQSPSSGAFGNDPFYEHSWEPSKRGADTYTDLAHARAEADERKREREARMAIERREAELERRERELKRKAEMAAIEARRRREAEEEAERRRKAKEDKRKAPKQQRPKFNFEKEKPQIMVAVANAIQSATSLINACRLINRETENITESPRVQDNLDKAKAARRVIIRYIQVVTDEEYVGTLLDANEKVVEAIQLYDKLSKPAALDSDSETEHHAAPPPEGEDDAAQVERIRNRLAAQHLETQRTGEIETLQEQQRVESQRRAARRERSIASSGASRDGSASAPVPHAKASTYADIQDLDFSQPAPAASRLPPPISPDSDQGSYGAPGSLSEFSDYDSSDEEWRAAHGASGSSPRNPRQYAYDSQRYDARYARGGASGSSSRAPPAQQTYAALDDDADNRLIDPNDPFSDPFADDNFADDNETHAAPKKRMECE